MKAIDMIRWALEKTDGWMAGTAGELRDSPLVQPTSRGGNHPLWTVGHIAVVEGDVRHILFGEPNPVEHWKPLFGQGSKPTADAVAYPPYDEILATYRDLRAKNLTRLEEIGEAGLDRAPAAIPPGFENEMSTMGHTLLVIALHQMSHVGQLTVARRASGKEPRF
jgi:hypothetical protein